VESEEKRKSKRVTRHDLSIQESEEISPYPHASSYDHGIVVDYGKVDVEDEDEEEEEEEVDSSSTSTEEKIIVDASHKTSLAEPSISKAAELTAVPEDSLAGSSDVKLVKVPSVEKCPYYMGKCSKPRERYLELFIYFMNMVAYI